MSLEMSQMLIIVIPSLLSAIVAVITLMLARKTHKIINGELDKWKNSELVAKLAEGKLAGRAELTSEQDQKAVAVAQGHAEAAAERPAVVPVIKVTNGAAVITEEAKKT